MTDGAVKPSSLRTSYCLSGEHVCNGLYLPGYIERGDFFLSLQSLRGLPVTCIAFRFNAYSVIKQFSFSNFVERFSGLAGNFIFNHSSPTPSSVEVATGWLAKFY